MHLPTVLLEIPFFEGAQIKTVYMGCAIVGGAVMSIQMLLLMFGGDIGADTDIDDIDTDGDGFGFLSVRSIAAFLTFFGLVGLWGLEEGWGGGKTAGIALGAGLSSMLVVAWVMAMMAGLGSDGNIDQSNAVGSTAKVYLKIPAENSGKGKITVSIQGRSQQYEAITRGAELPTGADVKVVSRITAGTFEVEAL